MNINRLSHIYAGEIYQSVPMKDYCTFRTGGNADYLVLPKNQEELKEILHFVSDNRSPYTILGKGSNVLISDNGIEGLVIVLTEMKHIEIHENTITCGTGNLLSELSTYAMKNDLSGLEFASGIPGTVGGAIYMNAGAYGSEIKDIVTKVMVFDQDQNLQIFTKEQMHLEYRSSVFQHNKAIIVSAEFTLKKDHREEIQKTIKELLEKRREKQPLDYPSAGSTFKRPNGNYAGALIEQSGLKGYQIGGAQISRKHAGFVINESNATTADILALIKHVQETVYQDSGIELEPEVRFVGRKQKNSF